MITTLENDMFTEQNATTSVGFRHVVEDGLALLRDENLAQDRRKYVLDDLVALLAEAHRGDEIIRQETLFAGSEIKRAMESFSLLNRYLRTRYDEELASKLQESKEALENLRSNTRVSKAARSTAIEVLEALLSGMKREGGTGIPTVPEEISLIR
jgi:ribosomal protein L29